MDLLRYLETHFFTRDQLLAAGRIDAAGLTALAGMPKPTYRLAIDIGCDSFFGVHNERHHIDYYAKGYVEWIGFVRALPKESDARRVFDHRYRDRLAQLAAADIASNDPKLNAGLDAHLADEWRHFLDGTYGLCTRSGLPEDIAAKEVAIAIIIELTSERALTLAQTSRLRDAVDLLDGASAPFAPHERARSSRPGGSTKCEPAISSDAGLGRLVWRPEFRRHPQTPGHSLAPRRSQNVSLLQHRARPSHRGWIYLALSPRTVNDAPLLCAA